MVKMFHRYVIWNFYIFYPFFFLANGIKGQQYDNKIAGGFLKINFRIC